MRRRAVRPLPSLKGWDIHKAPMGRKRDFGRRWGYAQPARKVTHERRNFGRRWELKSLRLRADIRTISAYRPAMPSLLLAVSGRGNSVG